MADQGRSVGREASGRCGSAGTIKQLRRLSGDPAALLQGHVEVQDELEALAERVNGSTRTSAEFVGSIGSHSTARPSFAHAVFPDNLLHTPRTAEVASDGLGHAA